MFNTASEHVHCMEWHALTVPFLSQINTLEEPFLNVNCDHLARYNRELYSQLVRYPQEVIPTFDLATNELFNKLYPDTTLEEGIQVRKQRCAHTGRWWSAPTTTQPLSTTT